MRKCPVCNGVYDDEDFTEAGPCDEKQRFGAFAISCGLTRYPDPSGERYVYKTDGTLAGKKIECIDLIDELWNALVKAKGGAPHLKLE